MYLPRHFKEERVEVLHETMAAIGAAAVVGHGPEGLVATHVPIALDPAPAPWGTLRCHFARANPHGAAMTPDQEVLCIFQGPQRYISPNWYPTKFQTGKVVPTWNYIAVHAYGTAEPFDDPARLRAHLADLTGRHERHHTVPWSIDDAPADYIDQMCKAIIGFEIRLTRIEGKWKLSQNRAAPDRQGVVAGLRGAGDPDSLAMAALVEQANTPEPS